MKTKQSKIVTSMKLPLSCNLV